MHDGDEQLQKLVAEVLKRLAPRLGADGSRGCLVVVLTGATVGLAEAAGQLQGLILRGFRLRLAFSATAEHLIGGALRESLEGFPHWEVLPAPAWFQVLREADAVAVPMLSVNALSKLALLIADTQAGNLMLHALFAGKPLILAADGATQPEGRAELGFGAANAALRHAVEERLHAVQRFGATVTGLAGFAECVAALLPARAATAAPALRRPVLAADERVISGGTVMAAARRGADLLCAPAALLTPLAREAAERHGVRILRNQEEARATW
ncbi:MAG: flavoprotein [Rhodospirillaceae bacterium]